MKTGRMGALKTTSLKKFKQGGCMTEFIFWSIVVVAGSFYLYGFIIAMLWAFSGRGKIGMLWLFLPLWPFLALWACMVEWYRRREYERKWKAKER